jgi:hypothetical protein
MTLNVHNYKRYDLFINIDNTTMPFISDNIDININNNQNQNQNNNNAFKDFISSIIKIHNMSDKTIRIKMIALTLVLTMPQLFLDWWNIESNTNSLSANYLLVSIVQKQTFSFMCCYYIISEDLYKIWLLPNGNARIAIICKIDKYWCEYYSILGMIIVSYYYFINKYIDQTNIYILIISILKLAIVKNVIKR